MLTQDYCLILRKQELIFKLLSYGFLAIAKIYIFIETLLLFFHIVSG